MRAAFEMGDPCYADRDIHHAVFRVSGFRDMDGVHGVGSLVLAHSIRKRAQLFRRSYVVTTRFARRAGSASSSALGPWCTIRPRLRTSTSCMTSSASLADCSTSTTG